MTISFKLSLLATVGKIICNNVIFIRKQFFTNDIQFAYINSQNFICQWTDSSSWWFAAWCCPVEPDIKSAIGTLFFSFNILSLVTRLVLQFFATNFLWLFYFHSLKLTSTFWVAQNSNYIQYRDRWKSTHQESRDPLTVKYEQIMVKNLIVNISCAVGEFVATMAIIPIRRIVSWDYLFFAHCFHRNHLKNIKFSELLSGSLIRGSLRFAWHLVHLLHPKTHQTGLHIRQIGLRNRNRSFPESTVQR